MLSLFMQDGAESLQSLAEDEPVEKSLSLIDLLLSGGIAGQIIIFVLFILLFVAIYIYDYFCIVIQWPFGVHLLSCDSWSGYLC